MNDQVRRISKYLFLVAAVLPFALSAIEEAMAAEQGDVIFPGMISVLLIIALFLPGQIDK